MMFHHGVAVRYLQSHVCEVEVISSGGVAAVLRLVVVLVVVRLGVYLVVGLVGVRLGVYLVAALVVERLGVYLVVLLVNNGVVIGIDLLDVVRLVVPLVDRRVVVVGTLLVPTVDRCVVRRRVDGEVGTRDICFVGDRFVD